MIPIPVGINFSGSNIYVNSNFEYIKNMHLALKQGSGLKKTS